MSFNTPDSEVSQKIRPGDVKEEKKAVADFNRGAGWETDAFVDGMMETDDFYLERMGIVKLDAWSRGGNVVLVGDAGYCPSANTGMGTTSAMVGAYILAGEIGRHCPIQQDGKNKDGLAVALKSYEDKFRPFMDQVQKGLLEDGNVLEKMPSSAFGIAVMNYFIGLVSFLRLDVLAKYALREKVVDWNLPDYTELRN